MLFGTPSTTSGPRQLFYGGPTYQQAKRTAWDDMLAMMPREWNVKTVGNRIVNGLDNELWVVGMDKPQRVEGVQWDGCVIDESSDIKPGTFQRTVVPALSWKRGWCWRIGVPKRQGIGAREYRQFCEDVQAGKVEDAQVHAWSSDGVVPEEALRWARANLDPKDYREQFDACWETAGGAVFYGFSREANVRPCPYRPSETIVVGCDFNVDPMAWCLGHVTDGGRGMEWFDELFMRNTNTVSTLGRLHDRYGLHKGGFAFFGDATGAARKTSASQSDYLHIMNDDRFKKLGRVVRFPSSNPAIVDRLSACNSMFCNAAGLRRMHVDPRCIELIRDLESRHSLPGETLPSDSGDLGHITDAMGYAVHQLFPLKLDVSRVGSAVLTNIGV
jgi:hypothetical protein